MKLLGVISVDQNSLGKELPRCHRWKQVYEICFCEKEHIFSEDSLEFLISETFNMAMALLSSGCTKTACREGWLDHYMQFLPFDQY